MEGSSQSGSRPLRAAYGQPTGFSCSNPGPHRQMGSQDQGQRQGKAWAAWGTLLSSTLHVGWVVELDSGPVAQLPGQDPHQVISTVTYPARVTSSDRKGKSESSRDRTR